MGSRGLAADLHRGDGVAFLAPDWVQRVGEAQREDRVGVDREVPQVPPEPTHPPRLLPVVAAAPPPPVSGSQQQTFERQMTEGQVQQHGGSGEPIDGQGGHAVEAVPSEPEDESSKSLPIYN